MKQNVEHVFFDILINSPLTDQDFVSALRTAGLGTLVKAHGQAQAAEMELARVMMIENAINRIKEATGMAPRTVKETRAHDTEAEAATQIYQVATADAELKLTAMRDEIEAHREESFGMGALHAIEANIAYNEFLRAMTFYRVKESKLYKQGGMTWDQFCEARGQSRRRIDEMLDDIRSIADAFSANFAGFSGLPFNKIRQLGKQVSAESARIVDNCLCYGDESIPLTPEYRDDIQALIERIGEESKEAKDAADKAIADAASDLKAKDKVLKSKEDVIQKQERDLSKFTRYAKAKEQTPEEYGLLAKIETLGVELHGWCSQIETVRDGLIESPYPNACAAFITLVDSIKMKLSAFRTNVTDMAPAGMAEDDGDDWQPPVNG